MPELIYSRLATADCRKVWREGCDDALMDVDDLLCLMDVESIVTELLRGK
jgi:hypothetical protein